MIDNGSPVAVVSAIPAALQDLLSIADQAGVNNVGMLKSAAGLFVQFVGRTGGAILIDELHCEKEAFVRHLRTGKYAKNSVKSYRNYINTCCSSLRAIMAGRPVRSKFQSHGAGVGSPYSANHFDIVRFTIDLGCSPKTLSEDDLTAWRIQRAQFGRSLRAAAGECSSFRTAIAKAGLTKTLPLIKFSQNRMASQ